VVVDLEVHKIPVLVVDRLASIEAYSFSPEEPVVLEEHMTLSL